MKNRILEINLETYKNKLIEIYPFLKENEAKEIIENMLEYWLFVFNNLKT